MGLVLWLMLHCSFTSGVVQILQYPLMVKEQEEDKSKEAISCSSMCA